MRLKDKSLHVIVNFLLGVSWASMLVGAVTSFLSFYEETFFFALVSAFVSALPGLVGILAIEHFINSKEKLYELQKQTKILEDAFKNK